MHSLLFPVVAFFSPLSENLDSREAISLKHPLRCFTPATLSFTFLPPMSNLAGILKQFACIESFQRDSSYNNNVLFILTPLVYVILSSITESKKKKNK